MIIITNKKNALASDVYQPILWVRLENGSMVTPVFATPILTISGLAWIYPESEWDFIPAPRWVPRLMYMSKKTAGGGNTARYLGRYRGVRANGTKTYVNVCVSATYCAKVSGVKFLCVYFAMLLPIARHSGGESGTGSDALYISTRWITASSHCENSGQPWRIAL